LVLTGNAESQNKYKADTKWAQKKNRKHKLNTN
jgi:hypothetical protein